MNPEEDYIDPMAKVFTELVSHEAPDRNLVTEQDLNTAKGYVANGNDFVMAALAMTVSQNLRTKIGATHIRNFDNAVHEASRLMTESRRGDPNRGKIHRLLWEALNIT